MNQEEISLSIIVPVYNEEANLRELYKQLFYELEENLNVKYEILFIDDGSKDNSWKIIQELNMENSRVKGIKFSRNFGHQYAVKAGYDYSKGEVVITMDADLQHPPQLLILLYNKWVEGYQVVQAIRQETKGVNIYKKVSSSLYYKIINFLSDVKIEPGASDFRLLDKKVVDELREMKENQLFLRGIIPWLGYNQINIEYIAPERFAGESKYSIKKMFDLALNGIMSFSIKPLRLSIFTGLIISALSFLYIIYAIIVHFFSDTALPGWTSILISVLFLGGIQLISIGILGEYIGKLFIENKKRKNYIVSNLIQ